MTRLLEHPKCFADRPAADPQRRLQVALDQPLPRRKTPVANAAPDIGDDPLHHGGVLPGRQGGASC
jgi:hypothetical protein